MFKDHHLAGLIVSSNTENSLSLSACREQNMDSWKPGLEFSPLCEGSRQEVQETEGRLDFRGTMPLCCRVRTFPPAHSPTACFSRRPGSAAPSARRPTPPLRSPGPSCRWPGCWSAQSSADPADGRKRRRQRRRHAWLRLPSPTTSLSGVCLTSTIPTCRVTSGRLQWRS